MNIKKYRENYFIFTKRDNVYEEKHYRVFVGYERYYPSLEIFIKLLINIILPLSILALVLYFVDYFFDFSELNFNVLWIIFILVMFINQKKLMDIAKGDKWDIITNFHKHKDMEETKISFIIGGKQMEIKDSFIKSYQGDFIKHGFYCKFDKSGESIQFVLNAKTISIPILPSDQSKHFIPCTIDIYYGTDEHYSDVERKYSWYNIEPTFNFLFFLSFLLGGIGLILLGFDKQEVMYVWVGLSMIIFILLFLFRRHINSLFS